jgi:cytochrome c2
MGKNSFYSQFGILVTLAFIFSDCVEGSSEYSLVGGERVKASLSVTRSHPAFNKLEKKWVSSSYFDRGMNYQNSRLEVVSFSRLLDKYVVASSFDAILLNCFDDYQGIVSADDVRHYDLHLAIKIELSKESDRPNWLQPLLIVVPNSTNPPFLERFLTANIRELQFVRLTDYYASLDKKILSGASAELGREIFKDNCLFCHSINGVGGNKGGSLLEKFDFRLDIEKHRFKDTFLVMHGQDNANKQNTKQFLRDNNLENLTEFLSDMIKGE